MPIITSNLALFFFKKAVSAGYGPEIAYFFFKYSIAGLIIFSSSLNLLIDSQCGFKPKTAISGLKPNLFL